MNASQILLKQLEEEYISLHEQLKEVEGKIRKHVIPVLGYEVYVVYDYNLEAPVIVDLHPFSCRCNLTFSKARTYLK